MVMVVTIIDGKPTTNEALSKQIDCLTGELTELDGDNFYYGLSVVSRLGGYFTQDFYSSGVGGCHFEQYPEFFAETIKYNDKVYSNLINAKLVKIGTNLPLQTIASKDGYSSNYTINKVDYNENNYEVSNVYVQFIPKYVPITYTVSYFEESNELNTLASTYTVESDTFALPTYEKDGYEFDGWYSTPTFEKGTKVTELPQGSFGNKVYYAKMVKVSADSSLINYVYCDYTFEQLRDEFISDWATYSDTGKRVFDLTNNAERKTTYAQWVATKAVLNNQTFVAKYKWLLTAVSNAIYEQNPWYKEQVKNYLTSGISAITEDTVYYHFVGELVGFWNQTKFLGIATYVTVPMTEWSDTITRNIAIETLISKSTVSQMTSVIGSELITPEKAGYTFVGWYTNAEYTGDAVTVTPAESCTLYAKWVKAA